MNTTLRSITAAIVIVCFTGCSTWTATRVPLRSLDGKTVRITTHNDVIHEGLLMHPDTMGSRVLIRGHDPAVLLVVDSLEVAKAETRQLHAGRTAGLVLLIVGVAVTVAVIEISAIFKDVDY